MRILLAQFYSHQPTPDYGIIAAELRARDHQAWVATPDANGDLCVRAGEQLVATVPGVQKPVGRFAGLPIISSLLWKKAAFAYEQRVRKMLRQLEPNIVQINPADLGLFEILPLFMPNWMQFILDFRQIDERDYGRSVFGRLKMLSIVLSAKQLHDMFTHVPLFYMRPVRGKSWALIGASGVLWCRWV